jgi:hypothetical protein
VPLAEALVLQAPRDDPLRVDANRRGRFGHSLGAAADLDAARRQGSTLARSSITIAARPVANTSRYFFVRSSAWPPTTMASCPGS